MPEMSNVNKKYYKWTNELMIKSANAVMDGRLLIYKGRASFFVGLLTHLRDSSGHLTSRSCSGKSASKFRKDCFEPIYSSVDANWLKYEWDRAVLKGIQR